MSYIIAGIHTGIGKTICSAVLCEMLGYDYWKPVQAGDLDKTDSIFVKQHVANTNCKVHDERYKLTTAASPHYAAEIDEVIIEPKNFILPKTNNNLIIETAGGVMSPLSSNFLNIDLIKQFDLPVILVSNNYLGSINHTLLTVAALQQKKNKIKGIVFCGEEVKSTKEFILRYTQLPLLFSIPQFDLINQQFITNFAKTIDGNCLKLK